MCIEVTQSCLQFQAGTDYGHRKKMTGTISSSSLWDTLSVDIVGPLPLDKQMEYIIVFIDCFSKFSILVPSKDHHTTPTVCSALLWQVIPYFGTPRRILSDIGCNFTGLLWMQ